MFKISVKGYIFILTVKQFSYTYVDFAELTPVQENVFVRMQPCSQDFIPTRIYSLTGYTFVLYMKLVRRTSKAIPKFSLNSASENSGFPQNIVIRKLIKIK